LKLWPLRRKCVTIVILLLAVFPAIALATSPATNPSVATFDDLPIGYQGTSFNDDGISFTNAYTLYNLTTRGLAVYSVETADKFYSTSTPGFTSPDIATIGGYTTGGLPLLGACQSFSFSNGAFATTATITLFTGGPAGNEITLEGLRNGAVMASSDFTDSSVFGAVHTLSLSDGTFDSFEVTSSGPNLSGMTYLGFDTVIISVPELRSIVICGMCIAFVMTRRRCSLSSGKECALPKPISNHCACGV